MSKAKAAAKAASKAAKTAPVPVAPDVTPASEAITQPMAVPEPVLKVISARSEGGKLFVTVEGTDLEKLLSSAARNIAYEARLQYGLGNAGIEPRGGSYVDDEERAAAAKENRNVRRWRRDFSLTQMI